MGKQTELMKRIFEERDVKWENNNDALKDHVLALNDEVAELQRSLDWKWWTNEKDIDWDNVDEELIDILFFTFQALILRNHKPKDVFNMYMDKLEINHERQDGKHRKGYDPNSKEKYKSVD